MAEMRELPFGLRVFLKTYRWRRVDPVPFAPLRKPLAEVRLALVSTAGMSAPGDEPFDDSIRGGDSSFREIANDVDVSTLVEHHRSESFDHSGIAADRNLGFPLDRLRELERAGVVGELNHRHFAFMGSITAPGKLTRESAPRVAEELVRDGVDAALLVPV